MDILKVCGIAVVTAAGGMVLRQLGSPLRPALTICGMIMLVFVCIPVMTDVVNAAIDIEKDSPLADVFPIILKVTAVAIICEVSCAFCESTDAPSLSKAVAWAGKFEIILLALPLFKQLYESCIEFCSAS